ncbi:avidin/streptavidin family protein [Candidatus Albibeggiatoa sp. nov. NOAA]|uniref:avidin/streptavidin family protein n=1 Tax=Candidatus Albibeggiatoa sp. nov. NOAA TaxID=3162724 RepID=UPI0032F98B24|nr:avidin/streptavidin family protein [Thiotrichaceae bacterium]
MSEQWLEWKTEGKQVNKPIVNFNGKWRNKLSSEMIITVEKGIVSGIYQTVVGEPSHNCEEFPLSGFVNGHLISFIVDWKQYGSITAWVGQHIIDINGNNERIETMWHLVKNIGEEGKEADSNSYWNAFLSGSDVFSKI